MATVALFSFCAATAQTVHLDHDSANRLRSVEWPGQGGWQYNIDAAGNIRQIVRRGPATVGGQLNDTGIGGTGCYAAGGSALVDCSSVQALALHAGQDGMAGRDARQPDDADGALAFSFVKLDASGRSLPAEAPAWACVRDQVTGLVWENKTRDGGPHDGSRRFTGYTDGTAGSSSAFVQDTNAEALCGMVDWRVPSRRELIQLTHLGQAQGAVQIDTRWHTDQAAEYHWSSDHLANSPELWTLDMRLGGATPFNSPTTSLAARLVRGSRPQLAARFVLLGDGAEVLDQWTGLAWQRCSIGMLWDGPSGGCVGPIVWLTHEGALVLAEHVRKTTGAGWRLPSVKELESIVDLGRSAPAIDTTTFPTPQAYYWASTPVANAPDHAWCVGYVYGAISPAQRLRNDNFTARLVRDASGDLAAMARPTP